MSQRRTIVKRLSTRRPRRRAVGVAFALLLAAVSADAENPRFQQYFFTVCDNASGTLAARCNETNGGVGDLSSDSESSLNPSQTLGSTRATRSAARGRTREAHERGEAALAGEAPGEASAGALTLGPLSLLVNGRSLQEDWSRRPDLDAERGYRMDGWGAQLGVDRRFGPGFVAGALATWETADLDFDREGPGVNFAPVGRAGSVDQESRGALVFANLQLGERGYADLSAGYIDSDYTLRRSAVFQESGRSVPQTLVETRASTDGAERWAAVSLGYGATVRAWSISPYLGATYSRAEVAGYRERDLSGSGLAMQVGEVTSRSLLGQAGVRISRPVSRPGFVLLPQLSAEYVRELDRDGVTSTVGFQLDASGNSLRLEGDRREADYLDLGVGVVLLLPNGWMPFLEYQTTLGYDDLDRRRFALGLRVEL